ncbi:Probable RNA-directed DNA polymerase from transposon X-element [Eumeta japonica]|uniref:Probable RNA-directed DNA polymerase from transposon X-element n=1 Tax=Eumeta variegata TaxID=151549 RepID=A0A4C1Y005_EUMVA|nr:Probable RNA-directed DNA polymerase from transposon X-element [Eumeta japonica]
MFLNVPQDEKRRKKWFQAVLRDNPKTKSNFFCCEDHFDAASKALDRLQVIQNKFCRDATDAHWCVRNLILHRDLELPTITKFMKDACKRFFDIARSHPNALLRSVADYEPDHRRHFIRGPRNVLTDPPNALTAAVDSLIEVNDTYD